MRRTSLEGDDCPVARSLDVIGDWWSLLIIRNAMVGTRRFSAFQKSLGIAKNMLAARLRTLVANGILDVVPASGGGTRHEYVLTIKPGFAVSGHTSAGQRRQPFELTCFPRQPIWKFSKSLDTH
jgi:DNA-binding HxlR family transcriptional regulator